MLASTQMLVAAPVSCAPDVMACETSSHVDASTGSRTVIDTDLRPATRTLLLTARRCRDTDPSAETETRRTGTRLAGPARRSRWRAQQPDRPAAALDHHRQRRLVGDRFAAVGGNVGQHAERFGA